jgi:tripartite-type tricarboxylate transporter receptor subunit TctC
VSETWNAISAPPKTPMAIVTKLNEAVNAALQEPGVKQRFRDLQLLAGGGSPQETKKFVADERAMWAKVIHDSGVPLQ